MLPWDLFKKYCYNRWDAKEFDLIKQSTLSHSTTKADPNSIARNEYKKLIYGTGSI
jgi:zinc protease